MAQIPTFYRGETIRVELSLRDETGVAHVVGVFAHSRPGAFSHRDPASTYEDIRLHGEGRGQRKASVAITGVVDERTATGEYVCRYVQAHDARGNYRKILPEPEIRFRVENGPGDSEGPELFGWRFDYPDHDQRPWWRRVLTRPPEP
jgi:hypothetical protein